MSEIKGQLLGIIIVLMVFAAVGGTMVTLFTNFSKEVSDNTTALLSEGIDNAKQTYQSYDSAPGQQNGNSDNNTD